MGAHNQAGGLTGQPVLLTTEQQKEEEEESWH